MKQFQRDIKTILTRTAFNIPSHLVGTQLATPKRRLAALLTDLLIAAILSSLIGKTMWLVVAIAFMTPTFSKSLRIKLKKSVRIFLFITGLSIIVCFSIGKIGTGFYQRYIKPIETGKFQSQEDSLAVQEIIDNIAENTTSQEIEEVQSALKKVEVNNVNLSKLFNLDLTASADENSINNDNIILIENFYTSYKDQDTTKLMEYWPSMESLIAGEKIEHLENEIDTLDQEIEDLEDELEEKNELLEDPSFSYIVKALTNDIGLSLGWIAVYMIFCWFIFDGSSPGKKLYGIKIIRMNGHDLKLWYCFERFSGYAAGLATGLLGFLQIYWDDNRQCIHDKIASTVVVYVKPKKKKKSLFAKILRKH